MYVIKGWLEVDGEMFERTISLIGTNDKAQEDGWLVQPRDNKDHGQYSFIHFGNYVSKETQTELLNTLSDIAKTVDSNYSDCHEYIKGEFVVSEINNMGPELRMYIGGGDIEVREQEC